MGSGVHHVSCFADDESVSVFLQQVLGLSVYDRFNAPQAVTASMFGWPADNPGSVGARYGAGPNGLVEVMSIPAELKGTVTPGLGFATFTVKDLEARLDPEQFIRLGRGTLANVHSIQKLNVMPGGTHVALLMNGQKLQVSRLQSRIIRERLLKL